MMPFFYILGVVAVHQGISQELPFVIGRPNIRCATYRVNNYVKNLLILTPSKSFNNELARQSIITRPFVNSHRPWTSTR